MSKTAQDIHSGSASEPQSIIETGKRRWQQQAKIAKKTQNIIETGKRMARDTFPPQIGGTASGVLWTLRSATKEIFNTR